MGPIDNNIIIKNIRVKDITDHYHLLMNLKDIFPLLNLSIVIIKNKFFLENSLVIWKEFRFMV